MIESFCDNDEKKKTSFKAAKNETDLFLLTIKCYLNTISGVACETMSVKHYLHMVSLVPFFWLFSYYIEQMFAGATIYFV